jgi:hypothetical protein
MHNQHGPVGPSPAEAVRLATESWRGAEEFLDSTVARMSEVAQRFARRVAARESILEVSAEDCESFIHAATRCGANPSLATLHFRRTTLRAVFRSLRHLGVDVADPTLDLALPPKSVRTTRPLTDEEVNLVRICALGRGRGATRAAVALALAEATATTREIPLITAGDVDLDAGTVQLPGGARVKPRTAQLTRWGLGVLDRHLGDCDPDQHLVPVRGDVERLAAQAGTCNLIGALLDSAGLRAEPDVRPGSIRAWAGAAIHRRNGRIEHVASALGLRSLDAAADLIGFDWKDNR